MNDIKPIETHYKGYRFRSRLEARWAVFFDALEIDWQYEPQGFENDQGDRYLPDFLLPASKTWVEVKGDPSALRDDWQRMARVLDFGGSLPDFADSYGETNRGLLLLGDIPQPAALVLHPIIQHRKGLRRAWATFLFWRVGGKLHVQTPNILSNYFGALDVEGLDASPEHWSTAPLLIEAPRSISAVHEAYAAARGARFEHGQSGGGR